MIQIEEIKKIEEWVNQFNHLPKEFTSCCDGEKTMLGKALGLIQDLLAGYKAEKERVDKNEGDRQRMDWIEKQKSDYFHLDYNDDPEEDVGWMIQWPNYQNKAGFSSAREAVDALMEEGE